MPPKITVVGSANIDFVMQVAELPKLGETVTGGRFFQAFGGKGANQAVAAARAGGEVAFVGALGSDALAQDYFKDLQEEGLDLSHMRLENDVPGGAALIVFDQQGDNFITVSPGANDCVTPERVQNAEALLSGSDWIILQQEIPLTANQAVLELAAKAEVPVLLNYAPANDLSLKPSTLIHGLIVNEHEAAALDGAAHAPEGTAEASGLAKRLLESGVHRFVIITLGKAGSVIATEAGVESVEAFVVEAVDTTAAGDTFCGALGVALGEGLALADSVRFATAASALSVTKMGAQPSIPKREAIETFLAKSTA